MNKNKNMRGVSKQQAEAMAEILNKMGIRTEVHQANKDVECDGDCPDCPNATSANTSESSTEGSKAQSLESIAKNFVETLKAIKAASEANSNEPDTDDSTSNEEETECTVPSQFLKAMERVDLRVAHPMALNLSLVEAKTVLYMVESTLDAFVQNNQSAADKMTEEQVAATYLNAIFYTVDIMMASKATSGVFVKPSSVGVRLNSQD